MSTWIEVKKQSHVEFSPELKGTNLPNLVLEHATLEVCYSQDKFGNNYVVIPIDFVLKALRDNGYEIR